MPTQVVEPPLNEWLAVIADNRHRLAPIDAARRQARDELLQAAVAYTRRLEQLADAAGLAFAQPHVETRQTNVNDESRQLLQANEADTSREAAPLVMTGHQPTLYHCGIAWKFRLADGFVADYGGMAVAVVIDSDEGDPVEWLVLCFNITNESREAAESAVSVDIDAITAGEFATLGVANAERAVAEWPVGLEQISFSRDTAANARGLYRFATLLPADEIRERGDRLARQLRRGGLLTAAVRMEQCALSFAKLAVKHAIPAMDATLIVRRMLGLGSRLCDLPLSQIAALPAARNFLGVLISDAERFVSVYNATLRAYRQSHEIDNPANPFPDLQQRDARLELPFWAVDANTQTRSAVWIETHDAGVALYNEAGHELTGSSPVAPAAVFASLRAGVELVPRHALITALLRALFCDLFVHGTGGGKYDQFTDELLRSYWEIEPPRLAVATASRYLLSERRDELLKLQAIERNLRDMAYRPAQYFDTQTFDAETETRLKQLTQARADAVIVLKERQAAEISAKEINHQIRDISTEMRHCVETAMAPVLNSLRSVTPETWHAVTSREYPWILCGDDAI